MSRTAAEEWAKRVERWKDSGLTAKEFEAETDPIRALERKLPKHAGSHPSVHEAVATEIRQLRRDHPRWSYKLVYDNLVVIGQ